jgi:hypothetical protein
MVHTQPSFDVKVKQRQPARAAAAGSAAARVDTPLPHH